MTEAYTRLAHHLDSLPAGFPATESGVEIRILKRLFSEEEAEIAAQLIMMPESVKGIAQRTGRDETRLADMLERMSRKGLIFRSTRDGRKYYMAAQFVVGIWEYHLNDLNEDLIRDVNEYLPVLMEKQWVKQETKQLRVVPIARSISAGMSVMPYEAAEEIIARQSRIVVSPCICRREHEMLGKGCGNPMEVCLSFGSAAAFYEENGLGRTISIEEALAVLKTGLAAGLVLQPGNAQKPANICMCCGCCCQVLKNLKSLDIPAKAVHTNYFAVVASDKCIACESCVSACQMDAITVNGKAAVNRDRCIGCGLCVPACPEAAVSLLQKDAAERYVPPRNVFETYMNMARQRGKI